MNQMLASFSGNDLRLLRRDGLLLYVAASPLLLAGLLRWELRSLTERLAPTIDLTAYYPLIMAAFWLVLPTIFGLMASFFILDERDEQVLLALRVTPLPAWVYLAYRVASALLLNLVTVFLSYWIVGIVRLSLGQLTAIALLMALNAPLFALLVVSFAEDKVKGLTLVKGFGLLTFLPAATPFVGRGWELALALIPTYWPLKATLLLAEARPVGLYLLLGLLWQLLLLALLVRRFTQRV